MVHGREFASAEERTSDGRTDGRKQASGQAIARGCQTIGRQLVGWPRDEVLEYEDTAAVSARWRGQKQEMRQHEATSADLTISMPSLGSFHLEVDVTTHVT